MEGHKNSPPKNPMLVITFTGTTEFEAKREHTLAVIFDMSTANVKITYLEKMSYVYNEDRATPVGGREQD